MTLEMWLVLGVLVTAIILFITEKLRVDVVALGVVVSLMIFNILTPSEALAGFSNSAVLTIASLFVVGGAVMQTGLAGTIGRRILRVAGTSQTRLTFVLMMAVALLSGFMSDTGTVAVLLPAILVLARNAEIPPSKLLIPLSFGSLLGGATTLIGTPPNLIVNDLLQTEGLTPFGFFSYTPLGVILVAIGIAFMLLVGSRILPDRTSSKAVQRIETPKELLQVYHLPDQLSRLRVRRGSDLIGKTVPQANLRQQFDITVLKIMRPPQMRPAFALGQGGNGRLSDKKQKDTPIAEFTDTPVQLDDVLIVKGSGEDVTQAAAHWQLGVQPPKPKDQKSLINREVGVAEILLPPRSKLLGKTLTQIRFESVYNLMVLGIHRANSNEELDLKSTKLQFGDTLLVQGTWKHILRLKEQRRDFVVMGQPESMLEAPRKEKATVALAVLLGMLLLMITGVVPVATAAMLGSLMMVLTGCLTMDDAYASIDWKSLVLVAGMIPMSTALQNVGLVDVVADEFVSVLGAAGPLAILAGLFLLTSLFTQVLSNTATAVIVAPIALASAQTLDVQPHAFLMAVAMAASVAFASPVASPTNTLVMGAGNYRFSDYIKVGVPLIFLMMVACVLILPLLFPF